MSCAPAHPPTPVTAASPEAIAAAETDVGRMLDEWHAAAARADEEAYFSHFARDGVFLGTDATERWDVKAFRAYAHPHFARGKAWSFRAVRRAVRAAPSGDVFWIDEDLDTPNLGPARGSGVIVREGGHYRIAHYNLSVPIPNERFRDVRRILEAAAGEPRRAEGTAPIPAFTDPLRDRKVAELSPKLEAAAAAELEARGLPSLAVALVVDDRVALSAVRGHADVAAQRPATPRTIYRIGSITKTFTAAALLMLRDQGRLALDDRLDSHLPEAAALAYAPGDARPITLRQLLTHTSGLPRVGDFDYTRQDRDVTEAELLGALRQARASAPGTSYLYSNFGMALVGVVVGRASGKGYRELMREALFPPLGMTSTGFDPAALQAGELAVGYRTRRSATPEPAWRLGASEGAGGLYASLEDMTKWVRFQLDAWPPRDAPERGPLSRASRREAHLAQFLTSLSAERQGGEVDASAEGVGYAWQVRRTCDYEHLVSHGGAIDGFHAHVTLAPDRGFGLVVLSNALDADTGSIAERLLEIIAESGALEPREMIPDRALVELVGRWAAKMGAMDAATYEGVFSTSFREAVPLDKMQAVGAELARKHGACTVPARAESVSSPTSALLRLECARGAVVASAAMQGDRLSGLVVRSAGLPAPRAAVRCR